MMFWPAFIIGFCSGIACVGLALYWLLIRPARRD